MVSISKSTIKQTIYKNFLDVIKDNISDVTFGSDTYSVQIYTGSFPDNETESKSDYPIVVINDVSISWDNFTFTTNEVSGEITIDVFSPVKEVGTKMSDDAINLIESAKQTLRDLGLRELMLTRTDTDTFFRGHIRLHMDSFTYSFKYTFTKTQGY